MLYAFQSNGNRDSLNLIFLSNDPNKVKIFKTYNNKLNRIKEAAKKIILGSNLVLIVRT